MKTLCIIPCGQKKIWDLDIKRGPTPAKGVYVGLFAKKCREYAETFHQNNWLILSAKYGFLSPDDIVEGPYNVTFLKPKSNPIQAFELMKQVKDKNLDQYQEIVILGGKHYVNIAKKVFQYKRIHTPLSDLKGIGYMLQRLKGAIEHRTIL